MPGLPGSKGKKVMNSLDSGRAFNLVEVAKDN